MSKHDKACIWIVVAVALALLVAQLVRPLIEDEQQIRPGRVSSTHSRTWGE
jgi:hypothetical protein